MYAPQAGQALNMLRKTITFRRVSRMEGGL